MSTYQDRIVFEEYNRQHYNQLLKMAATARQVQEPSLEGDSSSDVEGVRSVWNRRLAYVLAITILVALTVTQVVIAAINATGGHGGHYLVK
jgi:hypothetical protein